MKRARLREGKPLPQGCTARKWLQCQTNHPIVPKLLLATKAAALNSQPYPCPHSLSSFIRETSLLCRIQLGDGALLGLGVPESHRGFLGDIFTPVDTLSLINSSEICFLLLHPDHSLTK